MTEIPVTGELPQRLGLRPAARLLGISHPALLKAVETGRVEREADGTFDVAKCRRMLAENTHPIKSRSARSQQDRPMPVPDEIGVGYASLLDGIESIPGESAIPQRDSTAEATRQLEWARARREQLRVAREEGTLVELAPVNAFVAEMIMRARDEFGRIPAELKDSLANEVDPAKVESILRGKIDQVLVKMSQYSRAA